MPPPLEVAASAAGSTQNAPPVNAATSPQMPNSPPPTAPTTTPGSPRKLRTKTPSSRPGTKTMTPITTTDDGKVSLAVKESLGTLRPNTSEASPAPNVNDELITAYRAQFDKQREIVTCKICYGLMYEPYTTSCGHTYCYICLVKAFKRNRRTPKCPECRKELDTAPAPAFAVREITQSLLGRPELLPAGETLEQHRAWHKEHEDIILEHRGNVDINKGGLWRGFFRLSQKRLPPVLHDREDNVDRCPYCGWELTRNVCLNCGLPIDEIDRGTWASSDIDGGSERHSTMGELDLISEDDLEADSELGDFTHDGLTHWPHHRGFDDSFAIQRMLGPRTNGNQMQSPRRPARHSPYEARSLYSSSVAESEMGTVEEEDEDDEEDDDEASSSMDGFIVADDEGIERRTRDGTSASESQSSSLSINFPDFPDEEVDEDDVGPVMPARRRVQASQSSASQSSASTPQPATSRAGGGVLRRRIDSETPSVDSIFDASPTSSAADEEDEGPVPAGGRRRRRGLSEEGPIRRVRPRPRGPVDLDDDEESNSWGYRQLETPLNGQYGTGGDDSGSERTTVGYGEPNTPPDLRLRSAGSLTTTADRSSASLRPASYLGSSRLALSTRCLRRRSSTLTTGEHYEDNDADESGSDTQRESIQRNLQPHQPQAGLRHVIDLARARISSGLPPNQGQGSADSDLNSDEHEPFPASSHDRRRRRQYNPRISMIFAQHQSEASRAEAETTTYPEFEHLREIARTPLASPRIGNRTRSPNAPRMSAGAAEFARLHNLALTSPRSRAVRPNGQAGVESTSIYPQTTNRSRSPASSRNPSAQIHRSGLGLDASSSSHGASARNPHSQLLSWMTGSLSPPSRTVASTVGGMPSAGLMFSSTATSGSRAQDFPGSVPRSHGLDSFQRPSSRTASSRFSAPTREPSFVGRVPPGLTGPSPSGNRRSSLNRGPFPPPESNPSGSGSSVMQTSTMTNPFARPSHARFSPRQRAEASEATSPALRYRPPLQITRGSAPSRTFPPENPVGAPVGARIGAARSGLRRQPSNDVPNVVNSNQSTGVRNSRAGSGTASSVLSEDERIRRARNLVRDRLQHLAQQGPLSEAEVERNRAAAERVVRERLTSAIAPGSSRQLSSVAAPTNTDSLAQAEHEARLGRRSIRRGSFTGQAPAVGYSLLIPSVQPTISTTSTQTSQNFGSAGSQPVSTTREPKIAAGGSRFSIVDNGKRSG